ncbi:MAG: mandelate racemase/muconate lactonizing enzyme family protein [Chloroflexota bacterium]
MRITRVATHVLVADDVNVGATSSAQDAFVVELETDAGITGIGESDVNPWIARACIEARGTHTMGQSLADMLIGADPLDPTALWQRLYDGSAMNGRRGALIHALGAVDIALWDIAGKAAGVPVWRLLGEQAHDSVVPYASLLPPGPDFEMFKATMIAWALRAKDLGFRAVKIETLLSGPYRHGALDEPDERMTEIVADVRAAVGPGMTLMVDVGYAWDDVDRADGVLRDWAGLDVLFCETPLRSDDLDGYARLHDRASGVAIAAGEWLATRFEFRELMDHGKVDVVQPDPGRVGGLTEALRVAQMAQDRNRTVVTHSWKTGITIAAAVHLAVVSPACAFVEYLPKELTDSVLRRELTTRELPVDDGLIHAPEAPGIGVEIDPDALRRFTA